MQAYWITYLAPTPETAEAKLEAASGQYRHKTLMQGASERELIAELRARGCTALSVKPARKNFQLFDKVITRQYKVDLLTAVDYNMSAGMSAGRAFEAVALAESGAIRLRLDAGLQVLERGGSFAEAIGALNVYDDTTKILLEAGERTGATSQAIKAAIEHYSASLTNMKGLIALASIVAVDLIMAIPSVYAVRYEMLPMVEKAGVPQGTPEQLAQFQSSLSVAYTVNDILLWVALGGVLLATIVFACVFEKSTRAWAYSMFNKVPLLGTGLRDSAFSATYKALSSLLSGGVTLVRAMEIVSGGVKHPASAQYLADVNRRLESGDTVSRALRSSVLSSAELLLLDSHKNQAQLAEIMTELAKRRAESSNNVYKKFGKTSIYIGIGYTLASALAAIYVYSVQASAMSAALG